MGCSNQKSISLASSSSAAFQNGKVVQLKDGHYYLQKSRYHDKLLPNLHEKFQVHHK